MQGYCCKYSSSNCQRCSTPNASSADEAGADADCGQRPTASYLSNPYRTPCPDGNSTRAKRWRQHEALSCPSPGGYNSKRGEVTQFAQLHRPAIGKAVAQLIHKACHRSFQQAAAEAGEKMYTLDKFLAVDGALGDKAGIKGLLLAGLADVGFLKRS